MPDIRWARGFPAYYERNTSTTIEGGLTPDLLHVLSGMPCYACFKEDPRRCISEQWRGDVPCEHVNIYAKKPQKVFSHHACSRLVGHCASLIQFLEQVETTYNSTPGVVLVLEDDVHLSSHLWLEQIGRFMTRYDPSGWDVAKLHGGGILGAPLGVQFSRHMHSHMLRHGRDWWIGLPWPLWGTAALLFNTMSVSRVLRSLRSQKMGTADAALLQAFLWGEIDIAISNERIFFPRSDSENTSSIEASTLT